MRFLEISIQNFLAFGAQQTIPLAHRGLVAVLGQNRDALAADSNGAGKSSLLEAVVWVLFGKTLREYDGDDVINRAAGSECVVSLKLQDEADHLWEIRRFRGVKGKRANDVQILFDGKDQRDQGVRVDTQEMIETLIGMDMKTFVMSVLMCYGATPFAELSDAPRKAAFDSIMQVSRFSKARDIVAKRVRDRQAQLGQVNNDVAQVDRQVAQAKDRQSRLVQARDTHEASVRTKRIDLQRKKASLELQMEEQFQASGLDRILDDMKSIEETITKHRETDDGYERQLSKIRSVTSQKRLELVSARGQLEGQRAQFDQDMQVIGGLVGRPCPTCKRPVDPEETETTLGSWDAEIKERDRRIQALNTELRFIDEFESKETGIVDGNRRLLRNEISKLSAGHQMLRTQAQQRSAALQYICHLEQQVFNVAEEIEKLDDEENPYGHLVAEVEAEIRSLSEVTRRMSYRQKALDLEIRHLLFWEHGFGNKGLKTFVIEGVLPFLNERVQHYADIVSGGDLTIQFSPTRQLKDGRTVEELDVVVRNRQGAEVYKGNSDGEKRRINTAIGWAFGDLAATRAKKPIRFKGLDEPFENLDETGEDSVMRLLHTVGEHYETILCVTHSDHLRSQFPNSMTVVKEGGFARLED